MVVAALLPGLKPARRLRLSIRARQLADSGYIKVSRIPIPFRPPLMN